MGRQYSKEIIISMCEDASKDMKSFYKADCVNYKGYSKEKMYYSEIIAEWLLKKLNKFDEIEQIERQNSYNSNHTGENIVKTNRVEEWIAKQLFNQKDVDVLGAIIDYQIPLKNSRKDEGVGKIDLLSKNTTNKCVYIIEFKKNDNKNDSLLRSVLEAYTYLKQVSKEKLFKDFKIESDFNLFAAFLVFQGSRQDQEYKDEQFKNLHKLINELNVKPFFIKKDDRDYFIISSYDD